MSPTPIATEIAIPIKLPIEKLVGVLTTACEGGIAYWLNDEDDFLDVTVKRNEKHNVTLITFKGADDHKQYSVGPQELAIAYANIIHAEGKATCRDDIRRAISTLPFDEGISIDAEGADVLVQIAAFGEIVYG